MNDKIMTVNKKEKENPSQDELLKIACERFTKKLKVSNRERYASLKGWNLSCQIYVN